MHIKLHINTPNLHVLDIDLPDNRNLSAPFSIKEIVLNKKKLNGKYFIYYTNGLCITQLSCCVKEKCVKTKKVKGEYIQISLMLKGKTDVTEQITQKVTNVKEGMIQWVYLENSDIKIDLPESENQLNYYRIFISKAFFLELLKNEDWIENDLFYNNVLAGKHVYFGQNRLPVNLHIIETLTSLTENKYEGIDKKLYIETKLKELFFLLHIRKKTEAILINSFNSEIFEKLQTAKAYLAANYTRSITIKQLSKIVFLNELKLKQGFKEVFGVTIHQFLIQVRMEQAKKMLLNEMKINEICYLIGYKNPSHFIVTFKKYYGFTPKNYSVSYQEN